MSQNIDEKVEGSNNPLNRKIRKVKQCIDCGYDLLLANWEGKYILEKHENGHQYRVEISGSTLFPKVFCTTV